MSCLELDHPSHQELPRDDCKLGLLSIPLSDSITVEKKIGKLVVDASVRAELTNLVGKMARFRQNSEEYHITFRQYRDPGCYKLSDTLYLKSSVGGIEPNEVDETLYFFYCEVRDLETDLCVTHPICIKYEPEDNTDIDLTDEMIALYQKDHGALLSLSRIGAHFSAQEYHTTKMVRDHQSKSYHSVDSASYLEQLMEQGGEGVNDLVALLTPLEGISVSIIDQKDKHSQKFVRHETFSHPQRSITRRTATRPDLVQYAAKSVLTKIKVNEGDKTTTVRYLPLGRKLVKVENSGTIVAVAVYKKDQLVTDESKLLDVGKYERLLWTSVQAVLSACGASSGNQKDIEGLITMKAVYRSLEKQYLSLQAKNNVIVFDLPDIGELKFVLEGKEPRFHSMTLDDIYIYHDSFGYYCFDYYDGKETLTTTNGQQLIKYEIADGKRWRFIKNKTLERCDGYRLIRSQTVVRDKGFSIRDRHKLQPQDIEKEVVFDLTWCREYVRAVNILCQGAPPLEDFTDYSVWYRDGESEVILEYATKLVYLRHINKQKQLEIDILNEDGSCTIRHVSYENAGMTESLSTGHVDYDATTFNKIKSCGNVKSIPTKDDEKIRFKYKVVQHEVSYRQHFGSEEGNLDYTVKSDGQLIIKTDERYKPTKKYGYKAANYKHDSGWGMGRCIVKLELLPDSIVASDGVKRKLRTDKAMVVGILAFVQEGLTLRYLEPGLTKAYSLYDGNFEYYVGNIASPLGSNFYPSLREVCVPGIHFFLRQEDAIAFHYNSTEGEFLPPIIGYDMMTKYDAIVSEKKPPEEFSLTEQVEINRHMLDLPYNPPEEKEVKEKKEQ